MKKMKIVDIHYDDEAYRFIMHKLAQTEFDINIGKLIIDHTPSTVGYCDHERLITKLIKPRSWHEKIKQLWGHSRINKEINGFKTLNYLGIKTPALICYGFNPMQIFNHKYIGFHVTENLSLKGNTECLSLFNDKSCRQERRLVILHKICKALLHIKNNNIVFTDFHLSNVFVDNNDEITLIDPGLTKYHSQRKVNEKFNQSTKRLLNFYGENFFTLKEKDYLIKTLSIPRS
jgi:tRNA A-37 threonylcarbamoyl transferase component Bud32|tara:strand:+ start:1244 stop:1939 length:696 start_codon:yes stop_codon:yes gene_type:complete